MTSRRDERVREINGAKRDRRMRRNNPSVGKDNYLCKTDFKDGYLLVSLLRES